MKTLGTKENPIKCLVINNSKFIMNETPERETEKAIYVCVMNTSCGTNRMFWMPKSVITTKTSTDVTMASWFFAKGFAGIN